MVELYDYRTTTYRGQPAQAACYRDENGSVCGQHIRYGDKQFTWITRPERPRLFGSHLGGQGRLVITEGQLDAMSVYQALEDSGTVFLRGIGTTVVSATDGAQGGVKSIEANIAWIRQFEEVILWFDDDEPGKKAAAKAAAILGPRTKLVTRSPAKDANGLLQELDGAAQIVKVLSAAAIHRPEHIVQAASLVDGLVRPNFTEGILYPWEGLNGTRRDPFLLGIRPGEVHLFTGGTGQGKSVFVREIAVNAAMAGHRVGFIPLEETATRSLELMVGSMIGRKLLLLGEEEREGIEEEIRGAADQLAESLVFSTAFGGEELDDFIRTCEHLVLAEGCDLLILDHFSMLADGISLATNQTRAMDQALKRIKTLAVNLKFAFITLSHLNRSEGKSHEAGAPIQLKDLRGSHGLAQVPDAVVAAERNSEDPDPTVANTTTLRVLKNRPFGRKGTAARVAFDPITTRLHELPLLDAFPPTSPAGDG